MQSYVYICTLSIFTPQKITKRSIPFVLDLAKESLSTVFVSLSLYVSLTPSIAAQDTTRSQRTNVFLCIFFGKSTVFRVEYSQSQLELSTGVGYEYIGVQFWTGLSFRNIHSYSHARPECRLAEKHRNRRLFCYYYYYYCIIVIILSVCVYFALLQSTTGNGREQEHVN